MVEFSKFTLKILHDVVLANAQYVDLILNGPYSTRPTRWDLWTSTTGELL